jgi:hypothetical protein
VSVEPPDTTGPAPRRTVGTPSITGLRWLVLVAVVAVGAFLLGQAFGPGSGRASSSGTTPTTPLPTTRPPTTPSPTPSPDLSLAITVYNGTHTPHLAAGEETKLQQAGFTQVSAANAASQAKTTIYYSAAGKSTAQYIQQTFYPTAVLKAVDTGSQFAATDVAVVLGSDFTG